MSIYGGFDAMVHTSSTPTGVATAKGITTRLNPILDTSNINVRGTGKRGLYDILLGMRQPQFTMDILFTDVDFIKDNQDGQTRIPYLHYSVERTTPGGVGLTFSDVYFNRVSVEARHNEAISATIEVWAVSMTALTNVSSWGTLTDPPLRWLDSDLFFKGSDTEEPAWWSWRYEVNNNFQRLGNVSTGATRAEGVKGRHRDVTGLIVKDLASFSEWEELMVLSPEESKINIKIEVDEEPLLDKNCRWGRLEAPTGPEDLMAKRFPFTALDYT